MNHRIWAIHAALAVLAGTAIAADNPSVKARVNGIEIGNEASQSEETTETETPSRAHCINRCSIADTKCSSEVRRARSECSKNASTGGRDPFGGRSRDPFAGRNGDYTYWCSHFRNPAMNCGSDAYSRACQARFAQRYDLCVDAMYENIASMRYDCFRSEREAQNFCREELRDCKAACQ